MDQQEKQESASTRADEEEKLLSFTEMTDKYERDLVSNILRKNKRDAVQTEEEYNKEANLLLMMKEDQIRQSFNSCKASIVGGNIASESLCRSMLTLYVSLKRRRAQTGLNDRTKSALDIHIFEIYQLLFFHYDCLETDQAREYVLNLTNLIFDMSEESITEKSLSEEGLKAFQEKLRRHLEKEYPTAKKQKGKQEPAKTQHKAR